MKRDFQPAVYILATQRNGTLYVGVTSNLAQRVWQHREGVVEGFSSPHDGILHRAREAVERWIAKAEAGVD